MSIFFKPVRSAYKIYRVEDFGSFHETAKVVNSLSGETLCIPVCGSTNCQLEFERSQDFYGFVRGNASFGEDDPSLLNSSFEDDTVSVADKRVGFKRYF